MELINSVGDIQRGDSQSIEKAAKAMSNELTAESKDRPSFNFFRIIWSSPGQVIDSIELLKKDRPDLDIEVLDPYSFFRLFKEYHEK